MENKCMHDDLTQATTTKYICWNCGKIFEWNDKIIIAKEEVLKNEH